MIVVYALFINFWLVCRELHRQKPAPTVHYQRQGLLKAEILFKITFILQLILQDLNKIILGLKGLWVNGIVHGMWWLKINFSQPR